MCGNRQQVKNGYYVRYLHFDDTDHNEILGTTVDKYTLVRGDRNWRAITTGGTG